jgi:hypothetical protein
MRSRQTIINPELFCGRAAVEAHPWGPTGWGWTSRRALDRSQLPEHQHRCTHSAAAAGGLVGTAWSRYSHRSVIRSSANHGPVRARPAGLVALRPHARLPRQLVSCPPAHQLHAAAPPLLRRPHPLHLSLQASRPCSHCYWLSHGWAAPAVLAGSDRPRSLPRRESVDSAAIGGSRSDFSLDQTAAQPGRHKPRRTAPTSTTRCGIFASRCPTFPSCLRGVLPRVSPAFTTARARSDRRQAPSGSARRAR